MAPCSPGGMSAPRRSVLILPCISALLILGAMHGIAFAQTAAPNRSFWGVRASFSPGWTGDQTFQEVFIGEGSGTVEGSEFTIGFVRGSVRGGDVGVSFVRKPFKDTSLVQSESDCSSGFCYSSTDTRDLQGVFLQGVEVHGFLAFATIKNRVQIGVNVAGGIATPKGTVTETRHYTSTITPPNGPPITETQTDVESGPAADYLMRYFPLGKVEVEAGLNVAPGLKLKFAGGMNIPSTVSFRIGVVYLIGAK